MMPEIRQDAARKETPRLRIGSGATDLRAGLRHSIEMLNGVARRALTQPRRLSARPVFARPEVVDEGDASWFRRSFVALVVLPVAASFIYFQLLASDQYTSEMRFAVRGTTELLPGGTALASSGLGTLASLNANQDVFIVADYIRSQAIIDDLSKEIDLRAIFNAPQADFFARFNPSHSAQEFLWHWRRFVGASVEVASGILTVEVRTFLPEDSVRLARAIRSRCDMMVNQLLEKMRFDMIERAEAEVVAAKADLSARRAALEQFRNARMSIDPLDSARSLTTTITQLRRDLIAVEVQLARARDSLVGDALSVKTLDSSRKILAAQIAALEAKITSTDVDPSTASAALADYDRLHVAKTLAEKRVALAEKLLEHAHTDANRQHIHLVSIEDPTWPQSSLFPRRSLMVLLIFLGAFSIWSVAALTVTSVRDHAR